MFLIQLTQDEFYIPDEYYHPKVVLEQASIEDLVKYEKEIIAILKNRRDKEDSELALKYLRGKTAILLTIRSSPP